MEKISDVEFPESFLSLSLKSCNKKREEEDPTQNKRGEKIGLLPSTTELFHLPSAREGEKKKQQAWERERERERDGFLKTKIMEETPTRENQAVLEGNFVVLFFGHVEKGNNK